MSQGLFEVQVVSRSTGTERWLQCQATSREDAIAKIAALGEIVGDARLVRVIEPASSSPASQVFHVSPNTASPAEDAAKSRSDATVAAVLAWIGLIACGPIGLAGLVWGISIQARTNGRLGTHAVVVGGIATALWAVLTVAYLMSEIFR